MIKREESRHDFAFLAGVVIGAVSGALATLALAPRAGTETRDRWRNRLNEVPVEDVRARAASLRETAAAKTGQLREAASATSPGDVVQSTRSKVTGLVDRSPLPVTLSDEQKSVQDQVGEAASDAEEAAEDKVAEASEQADEIIDEATGRVREATGSDEEDKSQS